MNLQLKDMIEAIIFASEKPLKPYEIIDILEIEDLSVHLVLEKIEELRDEYEKREGGFFVFGSVDNGFCFRTGEQYGPLMERMFSNRPRPISRAAQETLAIIAYRQPVTRADIEFIRGVDAGSIIKNLLDRDLITCTGRKEDSPGRPMVFGTTDEFLKVFQLSSLKDLLPLESFQPDREAMKAAKSKIESAEEAPNAANIIENSGLDLEEEQEILPPQSEQTSSLEH